MSKINVPRAKHGWLQFVAIVLLIVICIVGTWIVARATAPRTDEATSDEESSGSSSAQTAEPSVADSALDSLGDVAHQQAGIVIDQSKSQLTYIRVSDGMHLGSANERFARPALSLSKLYIADYVIDEGTESEKYDALQMISDSDDALQKNFSQHIQNRSMKSRRNTACILPMRGSTGDAQ